MIAERGVDGLSLRAVARRFGATTGLVSHHFLDRAELVQAALDHATAVITGRILAIAADADPLTILAEVLPTDAATIENWRFALAVRVGSLADPDLAPFDQAITRRWTEGLPGRLVGHVDTDPDIAAAHLMTLVDGIALRAVLDPDAWPRERQLDHLRRGLAAL